jgi:uncharacterized protein (TIGR02596 family)
VGVSSPLHPSQPWNPWSFPIAGDFTRREILRFRDISPFAADDLALNCCTDGVEPSFSFPLNFPTPASRRHLSSAFTLLELMVVIGIIAIALGLLVPALGTGSGRAVEGAARQFAADLENARQLAIAERTRVRVLIPDKNATGDAFGSDLGLRGYTVVALNRTANTWKQRGRWTRLPQSVAFDPSLLGDSAEEESIILERKDTTTPVDNSASGTAATKTFTGAYLEFRPNGSTSLDPASRRQVLAIADAIPDGNGAITRKNRALQYRISIDPLTGSARLK